MDKFKTKYTIVQHSRCGYMGSAAWAKGLETRTVSSQAQKDRVTATGGILFDDALGHVSDAFDELETESEVGE